MTLLMMMTTTTVVAVVVVVVTCNLKAVYGEYVIYTDKIVNIKLRDVISCLRLQVT